MPLYYLLECDECDNSTKQFIGVKGLLFPSTIGFPSGDWHIDLTLVGPDQGVKCLCPECYARIESQKQLEKSAEEGFFGPDDDNVAEEWRR